MGAVVAVQGASSGMEIRGLFEGMGAGQSIIPRAVTEGEEGMGADLEAVRGPPPEPVLLTAQAVEERISALQSERLAQELFEQLTTGSPDFMEALSHAFVTQSRVERSSEAADTYDASTSAVRKTLYPIGYALRTYADKFPNLFPEDFDAKLWGLRLSAANSYLGAIKHGLTGYSLIQAYRYRSDIEEMLERLESIHAQVEEGSELKEQVSQHVEELQFWLKKEKQQWKEQAVAFGFNFTADMCYLVRWTKELQGVTISTELKNAIWGYSLVVSLPQKAYAVYKVEKKVGREKEWSRRQKEGAGVLAFDQAAKEKIDTWLEREFEKMGVKEAVEAAKAKREDARPAVDTILTSELRHQQALSAQTRNVLRTAAQQKQRIYHDMVAYERKRSWINLALGVMSATAWVFSILGVMAGTVTVLTTALPVLGISLLLVGLVYSYRQQPNLFKLYLSRVGVKHFFTQLLPLYGVKIKKGWHEWRLSRREGELAQDLELRQAIALKKKLEELPMNQRPKWATQSLSIACRAISREGHGAQSAGELAALIQGDVEESELRKLTDKLRKLDDRIKEYEGGIRESPMTRYGGSWEQQKAWAHWSDFLKVARRKGIASANQAQSGNIIAESLVEMISEGSIDDETKELLRDQLGISLPLDPSPDQTELTALLTKKVKEFFAMDLGTYGGQIQQRLEAVPAS